MKELNLNPRIETPRGCGYQYGGLFFKINQYGL